MSTVNANQPLTLSLLVKPLDAMQIAQLCAFVFDIPQLHLCRVYLNSDEQVAIGECVERLEKALNENLINIEKLSTLLTKKEYFDSHEARLRLAPEPDFEDI